MLRRPPRPPLPPSAHDVLREARLLRALQPTPVRVPAVLAVVRGRRRPRRAVLRHAGLEGEALTDHLPGPLDAPAERARVAEELVDALVALHAVDSEAVGLADFGRPAGYLERQVRRFTGLWEVNRQREVPAVDEVAGLLATAVPAESAATIVHGDYRLGNVLFAPAAPARLTAVLDWELATLGDPLADLGYLAATWSDAGSPGTVLERSPVTRGEGFPRSAELVERYAERTGREVGDLAFYQALALWKAAVFCEAIYGRWLRGETAEPWAGTLAEGVPGLAVAARDLLAG